MVILVRRPHAAASPGHTAGYTPSSSHFSVASSPSNHTYGARREQPRARRASVLGRKPHGARIREETRLEPTQVHTYFLWRQSKEEIGMPLFSPRVKLHPETSYRFICFVGHARCIPRAHFSTPPVRRGGAYRPWRVSRHDGAGEH